MPSAALAPRHACRPGRPWRPLRWLGPLSLALLAPVASGAVFAPGRFDADPPTGDNPPLPERSAAEPLRAPGFEWVLGPWRQAGSLALDARLLRQETGATSRQGVLSTDFDWATHLWQPWFLQLRFGLGLMGVRDSTHGGDSGRISGSGGGMTGRLAVSLFPASRFPFELRAEMGDSRSSADALGTAVRQRRLSLSQSWRPEQGSLGLQLHLDHSRLLADAGDDVLTSLQLGGQQQQGSHSLDGSAQLVLNHRTELDEHQRLASVHLRHGFAPRSDLQVESLANWNDNRLHSGRRSGDDLSGSVRQLTTVLSWRPREGDPLYHPDLPLQLGGSMRWSEVVVSGQGSRQRAQGWAATLGANLDLSTTWRLSASLATSRLQSADQSLDSSSLGATASWTPPGWTLGGWRYTPQGGANAGLSTSSGAPARQLLGLQGSHGLSRDWALSDSAQLSLNLTQSLALAHESSAAQPVRGLAHTLGLFWHGSGDAGQQRFAGLSLSDARTRGNGDGQFQLVNLQLSQRTQLSRLTGWSVNLTAQAARSASDTLDPFTGDRRSSGGGWQVFYTGSASLDQQRLFGVPRLRHSLLLSLNSQQLERRALGDVDAPRERISQSLESRLDYMVGRLELRLSARHARVDGRAVATLNARLQRRF
jgi:hypothetical protein